LLHPTDRSPRLESLISMASLPISHRTGGALGPPIFYPSVRGGDTAAVNPRGTVVIEEEGVSTERLGRGASTSRDVSLCGRGRRSRMVLLPRPPSVGEASIGTAPRLVEDRTAVKGQEICHLSQLRVHPHQQDRCWLTIVYMKS